MTKSYFLRSKRSSENKRLVHGKPGFSCKQMAVDEKYELLCLICKEKFGADFDPEAEIERFVHAE